MCSIIAFAIDEQKYYQVGKLTFGINDLEKKDVWIDRIYVAPDFNHKGIGSTLLNIFEKTCSSELGNNVKISGCILPDNDDEKSKRGVCHFYQNNGYKITYQNPALPMIEKTLKKKISLFNKDNNSPYINFEK